MLWIFFHVHFIVLLAAIPFYIQIYLKIHTNKKKKNSLFRNFPGVNHRKKKQRYIEFSIVTLTQHKKDYRIQKMSHFYIKNYPSRICYILFELLVFLSCIFFSCYYQGSLIKAEFSYNIFPFSNICLFAKLQYSSFIQIQRI